MALVQNYTIATLIFLIAGMMFFAGLIGAYLVLRYGAATWPAPGMPALPVRLAAMSTTLIVLSSLTLHRAVRAMRTLDAIGLRRGLIGAAVLGSSFLAVQAVQWSRLLDGGLSFTATIYGTTFYVLTGVHAVHAISGVLWLVIIASRQRELWVPERRGRTVEVCALYWHFVGLVWIGMFMVLYLL